MAILNAWLLYRCTPSFGEKPLDQLNFRRDIVKMYFMRHAQPKKGRPGRPKPLKSRVPIEIREDTRHRYFTDSPSQRRCAQCLRNTRKMCQKCAVGVHLHCFNVFHGKQSL